MARAPQHDWLEEFRRLHVDPSHGGKAPHKPLMLLALLDLVEDRTIQASQVELTPSLIERFDKYWSIADPQNWQARVWLPFFHLRNPKNGVWTLTPRPGQEDAYRGMSSPKSLGQLQRVVSHATVDPDLWIFLQSPEHRQELRRALIDGYFDAEQQSHLREAVSEESQVAEYANTVLQEAKQEPFSAKWKDAPMRVAARRVRDSAFRRIIRRLYDDTCSVCGLRLLVAVTGHSVCEAAHIIPYEESSNDDPRNGLGFCPVHHWCFDEGLFTVTPEYRVVISPTIDPKRPTEDRLADLDNTEIRLPNMREYRPAPEALEWHREKRLLTV